MESNNSEFIQCTIDAVESGIDIQKVEEECSCRMKSKVQESIKKTNTINKK